jgi:hypothetical protein
MAINLRNRPNDGDAYKVNDLALASSSETNNGVIYDSASNQTTVHIAASETNHDFIKIGDYVIPQRADKSTSASGRNSPGIKYNIVHPLKELQIISINKDDSTNPTYRRFKLSGDQRKYFAGNGSPAESPQGYGVSGILVRNIIRGRKYRISELGTTTWSKFGRLYQTDAEREAGRKLALVGTTFTATSAGLSTTGEAHDTPFFTVGNYGSAESPRDATANSSSIGTSDSPYIITGVAENRFGDGVSVNGTYNKITSTLYKHGNQPIYIELKGTRNQWTIYNYKTGRIYYEDTNTTSTGLRFDSPGPLGGTNSYRSSNTIQWQDRAVSVPTEFHFANSLSENEGKVIEVMHISSMYSGSQPLTNKEIDQNFIDVESKKLASDG